MAHVLMLGGADDLLDVAKVITEGGHRLTLIPVTREALEETLHAAALSGGDDPPSVLIAAPGMAAVDADAGAADKPLHAARRVRPVPPLSRSRMQSYAAGERIHLPDEWALAIQEGVVALSAVHPDGSEVLIGLLGPGDFILAHPFDTCHVEAQAQTAVRAEASPWSDLAWREDFSAALTSRVLRSEAWAAALAHPYIEQRLQGVLTLLGEQFGVPWQDGGRLIDLRLTHGQLASITGTTRATITRALAAMASTGRVRTVGGGANRRLCVFE